MTARLHTVRRKPSRFAKSNLARVENHVVVKCHVMREPSSIVLGHVVASVDLANKRLDPGPVVLLLSRRSSCLG
jgi:hypothetical protein